MFQDLSKKAVLDSIRELKKIQSQKRREDVEKRIDFYHDVQEYYIQKELENTFKYPDRIKLQLEFINITRMIIDEIACLYGQEPIREICDGNENDAEIYTKIVEEGQLNLVMDKLQKMVKLCKTAIIRPVIRDPLTQPEKMEFDILMPNIYDVLPNDLDPTKADSVLYTQVQNYYDQRFFSNTGGSKGTDPAQRLMIHYYYWDKDKYYCFNQNGERVPMLSADGKDMNPDNVNPYKVLPFITVRDGLPMDRYFLDGGDDLIRLNQIINIKLTELNYVTKMQAFSIPVRIGANSNDSFVIDPSMTVDLPAGDVNDKAAPDFKFVSPAPLIKDLQEVISQKLELIALRNKMSPSMFRMTGSTSSGFSIQMQNYYLTKSLKAEMPMYRNYEKQLFQMIKKVWNTHNPNNQMSEECELDIDFKAGDQPHTQDEIDQHWLLLTQNKIRSKAEWLMAEDPDIETEEEAEERLAEIEASQEQPDDVGIPLDENGNPIVPGVDPKTGLPVKPGNSPAGNPPQPTAPAKQNMGPDNKGGKMTPPNPATNPPKGGAYNSPK